MSKKTIAVIVPIILAIISIFAGGSATNWTFQIGDNTTISSDDDTTINEGDIFTTITDDIIRDATLSAICTADEIPETHVEACEEWNSP